MKTVAKYATKVYKKVPKKKLVKKAAVMGAKQLIGGSYLDLMSFFVRKSKKKIITYAGSYAYDSFLRSKFARTKLNSLPMILVSTILRSIINFLIFSRIKTGLEWLDFTVSIIITIIITLSTPVFYKSISAHEDIFLYYTNVFIDRLMGPGGWNFAYKVKTIVALLVGVVLLGVLQIVTIDSRYLQKLIIHTLITGFITDQIEQYVNAVNQIKQLHFGMGPISHEEHTIIPVSLKYKTPTVCDTKNIVLIGLKPLRAKVISLADIPKPIQTQPKPTKTYMINIMDDYQNT